MIHSQLIQNFEYFLHHAILAFLPRFALDEAIRMERPDTNLDKHMRQLSCLIITIGIGSLSNSGSRQLRRWGGVVITKNIDDPNGWILGILTNRAKAPALEVAD